MSLQQITNLSTKSFSPVSKSAFLQQFQTVGDSSSLMFLEKASKNGGGGAVTLEDITEALAEFIKLFKAGVASNAEILTLARAFPNDINSLGGLGFVISHLPFRCCIECRLCLSHNATRRRMRHES